MNVYRFVDYDTGRDGLHLTRLDVIQKVSALRAKGGMRPLLVDEDISIGEDRLTEREAP